jgi:hypothetical protein
MMELAIQFEKDIDELKGNPSNQCITRKQLNL